VGDGDGVAVLGAEASCRVCSGVAMPPGGRMIQSYLIMSDECRSLSPVQARSQRGSNSATLEVEAEVRAVWHA
jgi:hypothetical protein